MQFRKYYPKKLISGFVLLIMISGLLAGCSQAATITATINTRVPPTVTATAGATTAPATTAPTSTALPTVTPIPATPTRVPVTTAPATTVPVVTTAPATIAPVTTAPAATATPTTAPINTNRIMVVDGGKLVLVNLTNNQRTNVISGIIDPIAGNPVWSRNVNTVIFAAQPKDKGASLYAVAPSGGTPRKLLDNQPANSSDENPVLSPDGKLVAFTRTFDSTKDGKYNEQDTQQEIWLMSPNGQNLRKLADGHHPAFAPDSQRIVYATNGENNSLKMTNTQGQNTWEPFNTTKIPEDLSKFDYPFVGSASVVEYPSFIEGGRGLVFSANRGSGGMIITINTTNGGDFKLWSGVHEGSVERTYPNPATRAKFMYVSLPPSGVKQAIVLDVTKAKVGVTLDGRTQFGSSQAQTSAVYPAWSPDGTKIAYFFTKDLDYTSPTVKGALVIATARADGTYETKEIYSGSFTGVAWEVE